MREIYRLYSSFLSTELPYIVNLNPPLAEPFGIDSWLSRVNPDEWPGVHYGFTKYKHPVRDVQYLFVLARNEGTGVTSISYDGPGGSKKVSVQIAVGSGAILRIEGARISAALLKGVNDFRENYVSPFCQVNGSEISADTPCDLLVIQKGDSYQVKVANVVRGEVRVGLPGKGETKINIL